MAIVAISSLMITIQQSMQVTGCNLELFYEKLASLIAVMEKPSSITGDLEALASLELQIVEVAYRAEKEIDSKSIEVVRAKTDTLRGRAFWKLSCFLEQVVENIDSIMKEWMAIRDGCNNMKEYMIVSESSKSFLAKTEMRQGLTFWKRAVGHVDSMMNKWRKKQSICTKSKDVEAQNLTLGSTSRHSLEHENVMVGHENEFEMMQDQLTRGASDLEVVSIVGMGGIGKTTLANKIYTDPFVMSCFDKRAKVTISQDYCVRNVLLRLLSSISGKTHQTYEEQDDGQLADQLQKLLKGPRYLVVIDDIWTTGAWDDIKLCFPDCNCRSRILMTTRNMEVAEYASSGSPPYQMRLMNFDESWSLLYEKVFARGFFPHEFEQLGKQIASKCKGLPLMIVVIAGLLSKIGNRLDRWRSVAENVSSVMNTDLDVQCMRVLALSYYHLPHHLRACFLYFALFPEDKLIFVNELVKLWAAEGFLKVDETKSMEQVAKQSLKDLVDRSLVFIQRVSSFDGKIKACGMHDVIRELCLREARKINFVNVIMDNQNPSEQAKHFSTTRVRISIQSKQSKTVVNRLSMVRNDDSCSIVLSVDDPSSSNMMQALKRFKVLRVLDLASSTLNAFPSCIVELFHLRYLALSVYSSTDDRGIDIPPSIASLQYLQTLILKSPTSLAWKYSRPFILPSEIFKMSQLRHLSLDWNYLKQHESIERSWLLRNLQCLSGWNPLSCTSSIFRLLPNVKKLQIYGIQEGYIRSNKDEVFHSLCYLDQLKELDFKMKKTAIVRPMFPTRLILPSIGTFLKNLKKLAFRGTRLHWKDLEILGKLPKLKALKLGYDACLGTDWEVGEEGFPHLKFLRLKQLYLHKWIASSDHFPCLERLVINRCWSMYSIPQDFVDITTLQLIHVSDSAKSVGNSAKMIQQEIEDNYGSSVEVCIS
ncbi:putative late blight resistance protein homolog R1A-3 [Solanum lycopersicum]|uniref:putative late blight resistance protein homolog R1A-3 n=1 Tax=Solanum lycopersicum TaxID=4081 RepID=UPI0002BC958A|nr:putative late blight resistance protein homolog R1B-16 [Solanum lycopersicum]XP_025884479.1 putative late blight resistance protein homolog R1B-16 [Solanum lycopersicum]